MTRRVLGAGVLVEAALLYVLTTAAAAEPSPPNANAQGLQIDLFHAVDSVARILTINPRLGRARHRFRLELQGARAQAEDWLRDAGFSLLEERDGEGQRSYAVISGALVTEWPVVRLRVRVGNPQLAAGLRLRRNVPAIGLTIPWGEYAFEVEGAQEKNLGYLFMATLSRSDPQQRFQYGIAFPVTFGAGPSVGALLQLRMRFGQ